MGIFFRNDLLLSKVAALTALLTIVLGQLMFSSIFYGKSPRIKPEPSCKGTCTLKQRLMVVDLYDVARAILNAALTLPILLIQGLFFENSELRPAV